MRRGALIVVAAAVLAAAGCGGAEDVSTAPETVIGTVPQETTSQLPKGDATAGKQVFETAGCTGCHTLQAAGSHGNVGPNLDQAKPPFSLVIDRVENGMGVMPSFKDQLSPQQIANVATFVVSSTGGTVPSGGGGGGAAAGGGATTSAATTAAATTSAATTAAATTSASTETEGQGATGNATAGKKVFDSAGCSACHTLIAAGATGTVGPNLDKNLVGNAQKSGEPLPDFVHESIVDPNKDVAPGFQPNIMPGNFGSSLSSKQLDDLVAFIVNATSG